MKLLYLAICLCACGSNLRVKQDFFQPAELSVQLFGQAFGTATEALELGFLQQVYPDTAADVQSRLDVCEQDFWNAQVVGLQATSRDLMGLLNSCTAADPTAAASELLEDLIAMIAAVAAECDTGTDLQVDINNYLAGLIVEAYQLSLPVVGPADQLVSTVVPPFVNPPQLIATVDAGFRALGVTQEAIDNTEANARALIADWNRMQAQVAATGVPSPEDTAACFNDMWALANTDGIIWAQVFRSLEQYAVPALQTLCSFFPSA